MVNLRHREAAARLGALRGFARGLGVPEEVALALYERELRELGAGAKVERFLEVLAEKHARDALRSQARPRYAPPADTRKAPGTTSIKSRGAELRSTG